MRALPSLIAVSILALAGCEKPATPPIATETLPPPATQASPVDPASCKSADLALKRLSEDAGAGQRHVVYALTNRSGTACTLQGFVSAAWYDAGGELLSGVNVLPTMAGDAVPVTVAPAGRAVFTVSYTGIQATDKACVSSTTLQVIAPMDTQIIQIPDVVSPCTDHITLNPIRAEQPDDALTGG